MPIAPPTAIDFTRRPNLLRLAIALVLLGGVLNVLFLFYHCPFQLSEDEAHYWEWSRHLDYGYYSKPPGIAWLMHATLWLTNANPSDSGQELMPLLRLPAVIFGMLSGLLSLFLARRIFKDDRAALAVILLSAAVPMFAIGSLLITIDSPMYLCWAATVYCLWRQVEDGGRVRWLYLAAVACAAGMLFKPVLIAVPLCAVVAAYFDPAIRRALATFHAVIAVLIVLASQAPVVVWNAEHHWVTFRHIGTQGGLAKEATAKAGNFWSPLARVGEYIGGQAGGMGGVVFILLVIAVILAMKLRKNPAGKLVTEYSELRTEGAGLVFLLSFTLPLWLFYLALSLWKGTEINWPAASYFTGMILLGGIFAAGWNSAVAATQRWWRIWGTATIAVGIVATGVAFNLYRFYPLFPALAKKDPTAIKLQGFSETADVIQTERQKILAETHQDPLLIATRYGTSSSLSFYLDDHPFVFCIMSSVGGRHNQYDLWPGPNQAGARGAPALIVGINSGDVAVDSFLKPAFERLEGPDLLTVTTHGVPLRTISVYRGYGFKGFPASSSGTY